MAETERKQVVRATKFSRCLRLLWGRLTVPKTFYSSANSKSMLRRMSAGQKLNPSPRFLGVDRWN